jgi:hypothetical protein
VFALGWIIKALALRENAFAVTVVRLQAERQHSLVDTGPYYLVRHPMYAGSPFVLLGLSLWLGFLRRGLVRDSSTRAAYDTHRDGGAISATRAAGLLRVHGSSAIPIGAWPLVKCNPASSRAWARTLHQAVGHEASNGARRAFAQ